VFRSGSGVRFANGIRQILLTLHRSASSRKGDSRSLRGTDCLGRSLRAVITKGRQACPVCALRGALNNESAVTALRQPAGSKLPDQARNLFSAPTSSPSFDIRSFILHSLAPSTLLKSYSHPPDGVNKTRTLDERMDPMTVRPLARPPTRSGSRNWLERGHTR
jgi:hypothetical protein